MRKNNENLCIFLLLLFLAGCATTKSKVEISKTPILEKTAETSTYNANEIILNHKYFIISYNKYYRLANWVKYSLTKSDLNGTAKRIKKFKADPLLVKLGIPPVTHEDYTNSGFTRGHLAPAEDFSRSKEAIESTFIMSNVIPQKGSVNSGSWAQLERQVRSWACGEEKITVLTGPVLGAELQKIKKSITIPNEFFKVIIDETPPRKVIAFVYTQTAKHQTIKNNQAAAKAVIANNHLNVEEVADSTISDWKSCK